MPLTIKSTVLRGAIFPITLFAFATVGVEYFDVVFNTNTRWLFLAVLGVVLLFSGRLFDILTTKLGLPLMLYGGWALMTSLWSIVPELSLLKGMASLSATFVFSAAGYYWSRGWTPNASLTYLVPLLGAALIASFSDTTVRISDYMELYEGLAGNPNYLGLIVTAASPVALYLAYRAFGTNRNGPLQLISIALNVGLAVLLWRTGSRSSLACAVFVVGFAWLALGMSRVMTIGVIAVCLAGVAAIAVPEVQERAYEHLVVKYSPDGDVFFSRRVPWQKSVEAAEQGGWLGLGFGTSYGETDFAVDLSATGYGREKGNAQLAIAEEIGLVGLALYGFILLALVFEFGAGFRRIRDPDTRMQLALVSGLATGLLAQSCFEAWWTSPGSVESALFWSTVGVGIGLCRRSAVAQTVVRPADLDMRLSIAHG